MGTKKPPCQKQNRTIIHTLKTRVPPTASSRLSLNPTSSPSTSDRGLFNTPHGCRPGNTHLFRLAAHFHKPCPLLQDLRTQGVADAPTTTPHCLASNGLHQERLLGQGPLSGALRKQLGVPAKLGAAAAAAGGAEEGRRLPGRCTGVPDQPGPVLASEKHPATSPAPRTSPAPAGRF